MELSLENLPLPVLRALARAYGAYVSSYVPSTFYLRWRLKYAAKTISRQDKMLDREHLLGYMTQRELNWACFRRGFNTKSKLRLEQESFLREWLRRSRLIDANEEPAELLFNLALFPLGPKLKGINSLYYGQ